MPKRRKRESLEGRGGARSTLGSRARPGVEAGVETGDLGRRCGREAGTSSRSLIFRKKEFQVRDWGRERGKEVARGLRDGGGKWEKVAGESTLTEGRGKGRWSSGREIKITF